MVGVVQNDNFVVGYVFVVVIVDIFYYGVGFGIVYCELFVYYIVQVNFVIGCVEQNYIVFDDVVFGDIILWCVI